MIWFDDLLLYCLLKYSVVVCSVFHVRILRIVVIVRAVYT